MEYKWTKYFCFLFILVSFCQANSEEKASETEIPNFDFIGRDFRNTQTRKLCLLARLNASIKIIHRTTGLNKHFIVPSLAHNNHSHCDYNYHSMLRLDFQGVSLQLFFQREEIEAAEHKSHYCTNCHQGHWHLDVVELDIANLRWIAEDFPQTSIEALADGSHFPSEAGALIAAVSVTRGYKCSNHVLSASMIVHKALDLTTHHNHPEDWELSIYFHAIEVQPFLVSGDIIEDPVLCKDVSMFVVCVVVVPLVYFAIFIIVYRIKDQYGCPPSFIEKICVEELHGCCNCCSGNSQLTRTPFDSKPMLTSVKSDLETI